MTGRYGDNTDPHWLRQGSPSGARAQSLSVLDCTTDTAALATGVMTSVFVPWQTGDLITNITFVSGATAAGTPTHWWFALYDGAGALLAQTADQTSTAWAANTVKTLALATAQRPTAAGGLYAACQVTATTAPTLAGVTLENAVMAGAIRSSKILAQTSGSSLTTTAPATIATPTTVATIPFCILD